MQTSIQVLAVAVILGLVLPAAARSASEVRAFKRETGFPKGRPGFVVDHVIPLCAGGPDLRTNMQWQTVSEAKAKDRRERQLCQLVRKP